MPDGVFRCAEASVRGRCEASTCYFSQDVTADHSWRLNVEFHKKNRGLDYSQSERRAEGARPVRLQAARDAASDKPR